MERMAPSWMVFPWYEFEGLVPVEALPPQPASTNANANATPRATLLIFPFPSFSPSDSSKSLPCYGQGRRLRRTGRRVPELRPTVREGDPNMLGAGGYRPEFGPDLDQDVHR